MKVDYDSDAHSLLFEFREFHKREDGDYTVVLGDETCIVFVHDGLPVGIQLLYADDDIDALDEAAGRFELDAEGLRAAARAALAAPDREIHIEVGKNLAVDEAPAA